MDLIQIKLKQQNTWATIYNEQDRNDLLVLIKMVVYHFKDQKFLLLALYNAKLNLYAFRQGNLSNNDYLRKFNNLVDVATSYDGELHDSAILEIIHQVDHPGTAYAALNNDQKEALKDRAHELYCTTMFIVQADKHRYGKLQENLKNTFIWGNQDYLQNMVNAFKMLNEFKNWQPCVMAQDVQATAFAQTGKNQGQGQSSNGGDN